MISFVSIISRFIVWWRRPRRICTWCSRLIKRGGPQSFFSHRSISHGMCGHCQWRAKLYGEPGSAVRAGPRPNGITPNQ